MRASSFSEIQKTKVTPPAPREKYIIFLAAREENIDERHSFNDVIDEWLKNQPN